MPRVLTIQSHVVSGYVGNKCAVFPLQLLGIDVDPFNTVQVSNHSGYPVIKGLRLEPNHFESIFEALELNEKDKYDFVLSGYLGNPSSVPSIAKCLTHLTQKNPGLRYLLDPVLGDNGKLYLPKEMIQMYLDLLLPLAYIITPNQFEAELLSNQTITNLTDAIQVAHKLGPQIVIITTLDTPDVATSTQLALLAYERSTETAWCIQYPRLNTLFTGTGDLFSALLVACLVKGEANIPTMCTNAVWVMQKVLNATYSFATSQVSTSTASQLHQKELRLIHCKSEIEKLLLVSNEEKEALGIKVFQHSLKPLN